MFRSAVFVSMLAALLMPSAPLQAEETASFEIGIAPFLPISTFVKNYTPLTHYLSAKLGKTVVLVSAPDYLTFYKRFDKFEYPLLITNASSAYIAWSEYGYIPLLQPVTPTSPVILLAEKRMLKSLAELRGMKISMSDKTAVISVQALQQLQAAGLTPDKDFFISFTRDHKTAVNLLLTGEVDAAIVSDRALRQLPAELQGKVTLAYSWKSIALPGVIYLGNPHIDRQLLNQARDELLTFANQTEEGRQLMKQFGYNGLKQVSSEDMEMLKPLGEMLKHELEDN